jgi:lipid-A-disaccharide synthase
MSKSILIVSGEPSGDLHASNLVKDLKSLDPGLSFFGLGGRRSSEAGVDVVFDASKLALVGVVEVIKHLGDIAAARNSVLSAVKDRNPRLAILVDYPGFNLRLAKELKKRGIRVAYYISPQVWAWGADRIETIKRCVDRMVVLFGFEEELYRKHGVSVSLAGHPLIDVVKASATKEEVLRKYGLSRGTPTVTLAAGSRAMEVSKLLPAMAKAAGMISGKLGKVQFLISKHPDLPAAIYEDALSGKSFVRCVAEGDFYNIVAASDLAIVASGTATLETAILGTPMVLVYRAHPVTAFLARRIAGVKRIGLANIISGRDIVPELLQEDCTPDKIAAQAIRILTDRSAADTMRKELAAVKSSLGQPGASKRAATAILELIK